MNVALGSRSTATGPVLLTLRSSVDGFAANLGSATAAANSNWSLYSFAFNATGAVGAPIEFRIYGSDGSGAGSGNWRIDDLSVSATAIPEPATYMLFGIGLLACAQRLKRSKGS
jgi:hypothetical protein